MGRTGTRDDDGKGKTARVDRKEFGGGKHFWERKRKIIFTTNMQKVFGRKMCIFDWGYFCPRWKNLILSKNN